MSVLKLSFILELRLPNRLLCGAKWEDRPFICVFVQVWVHFPCNTSPGPPLPDL